MNEMPLPVSRRLLIAVPFDVGRMRCPVLIPILRVLFAPLPRALTAPVPVDGIGGEFLPAVVGAPLPLALWLGAHGLFRVATRGLKQLLAIRAAARRQRRFLRSEVAQPLSRSDPPPAAPI